MNPAGDTLTSYFGIDGSRGRNNGAVATQIVGIVLRTRPHLGNMAIAAGVATMGLSEARSGSEGHPSSKRWLRLLPLQLLATSRRSS